MLLPVHAENLDIPLIDFVKRTKTAKKYFFNLQIILGRMQSHAK